MSCGASESASSSDGEVDFTADEVLVEELRSGVQVFEQKLQQLREHSVDSGMWTTSGAAEQCSDNVSSVARAIEKATQEANAALGVEDVPSAEVVQAVDSQLLMWLRMALKAAAPPVASSAASSKDSKTFERRVPDTENLRMLVRKGHATLRRYEVAMDQMRAQTAKEERAALQDQLIDDSNPNGLPKLQCIFREMSHLSEDEPCLQGWHALVNGKSSKNITFMNEDRRTFDSIRTALIQGLGFTSEQVDAAVSTKKRKRK